MNMKKIIRRIITKTSRRVVVCHEMSAAGENLDHAPVHCPNCGELILAPKALTAGTPELLGGGSEETETPEG